MTNTDLIIKDVIDYTNMRIKNWYKTVEEEYGVIGKGETFYNEEEDSISVIYTEDGEEKEWKMAFFSEYLSNGIEWVFNCWSELA